MFFSKKEEILRLCESSIYFDDIQNIYKQPIIIQIDDIVIKGEKYNKCLHLEDYKEYFGVYIFLDIQNRPVYIGVSGANKTKANLRQRVCAQLTNSSHLIKNISYVESLISGKTVNVTRDTILQYATKILICPCGKDADKAQDLEVLLLSLCNTKYNR